MFGGYGAAYGSDDGHPRYRNMAEKSAAALKREEEAKKKFEEAREQLERKEDLKPGTKITMELLKPSCHLTGPCWTTFLRHVRSHEGWVAKRREATAEEKQQHKETKKGKVYFVDLVFNVSKGIIEKKPATAVQGNSRAGSSGGIFGSPNDDEESSEEDGTPVEKKAKIIDEKCSNIGLAECKRKRTITTRSSLHKSFLVPKRKINNNNSVITKSSENASEDGSGVDDDGDKDENYNQGVLSASIPKKLKKSNLKKKKTDDNVIYFVRNGVTTTGEDVVKTVGKCIKNINRNKRSGTKDTSINPTTEEASLKPSSKEASLTPSTEETLMGTSTEDNFVPPSTAVIKEEILDDDEIQIVEVINRKMVPIKEEVATVNSEPEMANSCGITLKRIIPSLQSKGAHNIVGIARPRGTVIVERLRDSIGREDETSCTFSGDHNYAMTTSHPPDEISVDTERRGLDSEATVTGAAADTRGASGGRNRTGFEAVELEETWADAEEVMAEREMEFPENNQGQEVQSPHQQGDGLPPQQQGDRPPPHQQGDRPPPHQQGDGPSPHKEGDGQPPHQQGDGLPPHQEGDGPPPHQQGDGQPPHQQGVGPPPLQQGNGPPLHQQGDGPPPHPQGVGPPPLQQGGEQLPLQQGDGPPPVDPGHPRPQSAGRESNSDDNKIEIEFNAKIRMSPAQFVAVSQKVPGFLAGCRYVRN